MRIERVPSLEPRRTIKVGRKLDGSLWVDISGCPGFTLEPRQAFALATGLLKGLGIELEIEWNESRSQ